MLRACLTLAALSCGPAIAGEGQGHHTYVNGMRVYYEISGEGEPLVVLHGAHMNIDTMGAIIPMLAKTHTVYALEFQGHGRTSDIDRAITYENLGDDVAGFMNVVGLTRADVFGYSMGAMAALQLAIQQPQKVDHLVLASPAYDDSGWQPEFTAMIPQMAPGMFAPFEAQWRALAPDPDRWPEFIARMIALEKQPLAWESDIRAVKSPVLIITGDADVVTLDHTVALFHLLGGGAMGDMGQPPGPSRLAVLPATSHTAVIAQPDLLLALIEPFLKDETPKGMFD